MPEYPGTGARGVQRAPAHGPSAVSQQQQQQQHAFPRDSRDFHPHLLVHAHTHVHKLQTPSLATHPLKSQHSSDFI